MGRLRLARPFVTITLSLALCALRLNSTSPAGFRVCQCSNNGLTSSSCQIFAGIFETIDSVLMTASNCLLIFGRSHLPTLTPTCPRVSTVAFLSSTDFSLTERTVPDRRVNAHSYPTPIPATALNLIHEPG